MALSVRSVYVYRRARKTSLRNNFPRGEAARVLSMVRRAAHHQHQVRALEAQQLVCEFWQSCVGQQPSNCLMQLLN